MGANARTIQVTLKTVADIKDVTSNVAQLQKALSGLSLSKGLEGQFTKLFTNVERNAEKASTVFAAGFKSKGDVNAYEKATNLIVEDMKKISQLMGQIDTSKLNFEIDTSKSKALTEDIIRLKQEIDSIRTQNLTELQKLIQNKPSGAKAWDDFFIAFQRGDEGIEDAEKALKRLQTQVTNARDAGKDFSAGRQWDKYQKGVNICANALQVLKGETGEAAVKQSELNQKTQELNTLQQQANSSGTAWLQGMRTNFDKVNGEAETYIHNTQKSAASTQQLGSELEQFKSRIAYFFGLNNAIALFQRALRSAYNTVKELDEVMTEMAVVTDFNLDDIWGQLPEYTARANELGVAISDAYEATTIFYQQGLKAEAAVALSNETLKMARIAGLDAAEATDRMTNALRGFNMELNETNAQRVDDVYNKLAAISASNVDEISTAMTKVASLANNANMEFETTSAFLAQMIETTRESAETAGTALKTVVARFSEVKELYSEGELLGTDSEGEAIDVNKVSTALRTAGINLNEYLTGMKGLDDIFIELAQKWDSLDIVQQRYIATMAAGSRQQSRFIAMMSDYDRTMELVNAANNSGGAANEMFGKTLDSVETKANRLKNAWNEFIMAIADNKLIKGAIDALTGLLNIINKLTGKSGIAKIGVAFAGFKLGKSLFNKLLGNIGAVFNNAGQESGENFAAGLSSTINSKFNIKNVNIGQGQYKLLSQEFDILSRSAQEAGQKFGYTSEQAEKLKAQAHAVRAQMTALTSSYQGAAIGANTLTAAQQLTLASQIKEGVVTQNQINLMGVKLAARYADAVAMGDEATAQKILNEAKAREIALSKPGIISLLTMIGLAATHTAAKTGETEITWASVRAKITETLVQKGLNKAMLLGLGIVGLIIVAVAGLIILIVKLVQHLESLTPEAKLEAAKEAADDAAESAQNAADAFNNLADSWDNLGDKYKALEDMTRGSQEWRQAVQEINSEVLELMDNYDGLKPKMEGGVLTIDEDNIKDVLVEYEKKSINASSAAIATKQTEIKAQINKDYSDLSGFWDTQGSQAGNWVERPNGSAWVVNQSATEDIARKVADGTLRTAEQIEAYAESIGVQIATTEDDIAALRKFGNGLLQADEQMDGYYTALSSNALSMAKVSEDMEDYANTFMSNKRMEQIMSKEAEEVDEEDIDDLREEYAKGIGYDNYEAYLEDHDDEDISDEQLKSQVAAMRAQKTATENIETFVNQIEDLSPLLQKIYKENEGKALNREDISQLTNGANYEDLAGKSLADTVTTYKDQIKAAWNKLEPAQQATFGSIELFAQEYANAILLASESYATATKNLETAGLDLDEEGFKTLSSGALKSLSDNLLSVFNITGEEGFNKIKESFLDLTKDMDSDDTEKFANALNSIDWSSADSIDTFSEVVEELDIDTTKINGNLEDFEDQLIECAKATRNINLETLTEQVRSLSSIANKINKGTQGRSFSEGDYKSLTESGALKTSDFAYNIETGNYDYLGSSTDRIVNAIQEQTSQLLGQDQLERKIASGQAFKEALEGKKVDTNNQNELYNFLINYLNKAGENASISRSSVETYNEAGSIEKLKELYNIILDDAANLSKNQSELDTAKTQGQIAQAQTNSPIANAQQVNGTDGNIYSSALVTQASAAGLPTEELNSYIEILNFANEGMRQFAANQLASMTNSYNEATALGIDTEQLQAYADTLRTTNNELTDAQALEIALANTKFNAGLSEIIDSYDDWTSLIDKESGLIKATTSEDIAAFDTLRKSVNKMLNTSEDLSDAFWNNADNMKNLQKAAEGDTDALGELQKAAAADYIISLKAEAVTPEIASALDNFANYILGYDLPKLEASAKLDDTDFIDGCNSLIAASNMTGEQVANAFKSLGYDVEIDYEPATVKVPQYATITGPLMHGPNGSTEQISSTIMTGYKEMAGYVPVVKSLTSTGSGGGGVSRGNKSRGAGNAKKGSGGGGKGGGGSSEKPSYWDNSYDELYNLQEKINESLRTREALERRYQKLLKKTETSLSDIRKAYYDQIKQLRTEANLQQTMAEGRARQIRNIANETYTNSEGVKRSFASMGVTKYASYDMSTGVITIDWAGLDAISRNASREEEGNAVEAYISRLEELVEGYESIRDELWKIEDEIEELREESIESYLDFEDRVMEAVVNEYQEQIDAFEAMSDGISEATDKVLNSIKEEIDFARQIRDNTKTEEEISDMENRLAYLRRDTSGANDLEIMQLEKELEDARQNYTDTLIDQALEQMQRDADLAAEQRAKQQETLQNQLDIMKENGSLWNQVYALMRNAEGSDGSFSQNSELVKLLKSNEGFDNLSNIGKAKWWEEASAAYKAAIVGKNEAEEKYKVDADNDGTITGVTPKKPAENVNKPSTPPKPIPPTKTVRTDKEKYGVALAIINGGYGWGSSKDRKKNLEAKGFNYNEIQGIINKLYAERKVNSGKWVGAYYGIKDLSPYAMSRFKSGGLADFTGPAWLDGTKSHPELVLDATDSQNFITLKNILAQLLNGQGAGVIGSGGGDNYFDIDISAELGSDYDVDQLAERIKKQIYDSGTYRNVNTMNYLR